ncbi:MAG: DNA topoisomerase IV subunit A [Pseudomonadota bacterium]|nr:DNA topoisomerase IV subunit A [Pseudomonadota bacterium]
MQKETKKNIDSTSIILNEQLDKALGERYLTYALSTITDRALPDSRDGLKPVHRRILYAMSQLKLNPNGSFRKCAKIVGEVMGNYHPHGDKAIYDSLVRLAQDFNTRYPLIEGQGNFGNIDGDNAAAQRYTEARLSEIAMIMLNGLDESAVAFRDNYDGSEQEPEVLPAFFPQLLANGAYGIAVGMATSIPPHNIGEICEAAISIIKKPKIDDSELMAVFKGPDFPTGGIVVESKETILEAYKSGRGSFRVRARYFKEDLPRGNWQVVITEIPYGIQKAKLIEKLADMINEKRLNIISDLRDESAEDIRVVITPKNRDINPESLMEVLFKKTDLEARFSLNMNVLINGKIPKVSSLRELLDEFLRHARDVLTRRSKFRLEIIETRLHLLEGYLVTFFNLDKVISIIRYNETPKLDLQNEFDLTEKQAEAILNMRLRSLRRLEQVELENEKDQLLKERLDLELLLEKEDKQWLHVKKDIENLKARLKTGGNLFERRTDIEESKEIEGLEIADLTEAEDVTIIVSKLGWIRVIKVRDVDPHEIKYREGDEQRFVLKAKTSDKLLIFGSNGYVYTILVSQLPGGRTNGEPVRLITDLPNQADIVNLFLFKPDLRVIVASSVGDGFIINSKDMIAQTKSGKKILNLKSGTFAKSIVGVQGELVSTIGSNRKLLIFRLNELPELTRGKGVRLQKFKDGELSDMVSFQEEEGLVWKDSSGRKKVEKNISNWIGKRAQSGKIVPKGFPRNNKFNL